MYQLEEHDGFQVYVRKQRKQMSETLYIVMPAYNEEANIISTLEAWYPIIEKHNENGESRLVVVNDGSKDNTYELMQGYAETHPLFIPLTKPNGGHGSTVIFAYDYAIKNGAAIFGNRTVRGDGQSRAFVEKVVCLIVKHYFGVNVPDANAPFRLMRADKVKQYLYKLKPDYDLPNIMLTTYFVYYKDRAAFKEISFKPREKGTNSINIKRIVKIGWEALKDFRQLKKEL